MKLPTTPDGWAVRVSSLVKAAREIQGLPRFPIDVAAIARDYSRNVFPGEPITLVHGEALGERFEGALAPNPKAKGEWGIIYNSSIKSKGRINFTLAHELGHYLLHRQGEPIFCSKRDMWAWDSEYGAREAEANRFASVLLMPFDDFRVHTETFRRPTLSDFEFLRDRYEVSVTAAILKWLEMTTRRAMLVVSKDGFIDWSWGSTPLFKSGVFFRARQETIAIPERSLAASAQTVPNNSVQHPPGVWHPVESVFESVLFSEYHDMSLSLLIYSGDAIGRSIIEMDDETVPDTFDKFSV
ncbi:ImmA/IrrE family metallo-endopeptidase [Bradyrhizobium sp. Ec3.3]|uniref:ImmA/IrrE family metallo-endopeptidase n=1 Tax=Bradyrhizobium sp. Ec3.3 TaxID=189753 RepID=UPI0004841B61|nr:ImmA/IrrE family metallo-endopeptidase [Bradyrhizobium sp. Ec3.3]